MAEQLILEGSTRAERYRELYPQLQALLGAETDRIANLANMAAALRQTFGFFWVGFYLVSERELILGPFQGDIACTRIPYGRGVCGDAWARGMIVVPIRSVREEVVGVLDVDSQELGDFTEEIDRPWLEQYIGLLAPLFP